MLSARGGGEGESEEPSTIFRRGSNYSLNFILGRQSPLDPPSPRDQLAIAFTMFVLLSLWLLLPLFGTYKQAHNNYLKI